MRSPGGLPHLAGRESPPRSVAASTPTSTTSDDPSTQFEQKQVSWGSAQSSASTALEEAFDVFHVPEPSPWPQAASSVLAALAVGFVLASILTPVDVALLRSGQPGEPPLHVLFVRSFCRYVAHPLQQCSAFLWTWFLISATYATAGLSRTFCAQMRWSPTLTVWFTTTVVNCTIVCVKDAAMSGGTLVPPLSAVVVWVARDLVFSLVVFVLPTPLERLLISRGYNHILGFRTEDMVQILLPLPLQLVTTPLQYLGLSYVNHPQLLPWAHRCAAAFDEFLPRCGVRCVRVLVPYCLGAVANRRLHKGLEAHFRSQRAELPVRGNPAAASAVLHSHFALALVKLATCIVFLCVLAATVGGGVAAGAVSAACVAGAVAKSREHTCRGQIPMRQRILSMRIVPVTS